MAQKYLFVFLVCATIISAEVDLQAENRQLVPRISFKHACKCCICFAMDESGSIDNTEWNEQVNFVKLLTTWHYAFNLGCSRYAAAAFESDPESTTISKLQSSASTFFGIVMGYARNTGGRTNIGAGLKRCKSILDSAARGTCDAQTIVLLSDGFGTFDAGDVAMIKNSGTSIVTVGIGNSINSAVLENIASRRSCFFRTTFPILKTLPRVPLGIVFNVPSRCPAPFIFAIVRKFCLVVKIGTFTQARP